MKGSNMSALASDNFTAEKQGRVWFVWVHDLDGNPIAVGCDKLKQKAVFKAGMDFAREAAKGENAKRNIVTRMKQ
jgi:hypothetical protein